MQYSDENLLWDYAQRTRKNLEFIERTVREQPEAELFEVTQLINSLLGLLVFPFERLRDQIPTTSLADLRAQGWVVPEVSGDFPQVEDLSELVRYLRNSVAHFNLEFIADENGKIEGLHIWNVNRGRRNWEAKIKIAELRDLTNRFLDLIQEQVSPPQDRPAPGRDKQTRLLF
jgi:hypothetical protein